MPRDIYIVRHGNTFDKGDTVTRVGARTDLDLSVSGQAQADALGTYFRDKGIVFSRTIAGPLKRTRQTADTIRAAQANPPALEIADFLREIDYGPDENQPEDKVVARIGQDALDRWEHEAIAPPGWVVDPDALAQNWKYLFILLGQAENDGPVLVVTSNGIARFARQVVETAPDLPESTDLKLKTGAFAKVRLEGGVATLAAWNVRP